MAKGRIEFNTFVKGLVTEAGPLTYPDNASLDEANYVLNRDGSRQRRFGMGFEDDYVLHPLDSLTTGAVTSHRWENPDNIGDFEILVVQDGNKLKFFNANSDVITADSISQDLTLSQIDATKVLSMASIDGKLFIAGGGALVYALSYNRDFETIAIKNYVLHMRDLWGVDDGLDPGERPETLSETHRYNLRNQGWPETFLCAGKANGGEGSNEDPLDNTFSHQDFYPSNSDVIHANFLEASDHVASIGAYSSWGLYKGTEGTIEAGRGSKILEDIWDRGGARLDVSDVSTGLPADKALGGVTNVAAYAGRLFYSFQQTSLTGSDDNSPNLNTMIAFSQVGTENAQKCYTQNDQTSENFNDVLATDGGFVVIPEMGEVYALAPLGNSLFVIASNGVWEIHGGENTFSATNQSLSKTSSIGALSRKGVLTAEDGVAYWAKSGLQVISIDPTSLRGVSTNITQATIQSLYDSIPQDAKREVTSVYDNASRQMRWLYRSTTLPSGNLYDSELIYDLNLQAFYKNEFNAIDSATDTAYVMGYIDVADIIISQPIVTPVTDGGVTVTDGGEDVTAGIRTVSESTKLSTKFLVAVKEAGDWNYTVAQLGNIDFYDWPDIGDGIDSPARLVTGYWTGGKSTQDKRMPYLFTHFRRTEQGFTDEGNEGGFEPIGPSSCLVQAQWEWTETEAAGRWGVEFQAYKLPRLYTPEDVNDSMDYGYTVVTTKNKVRGRGNALSLNFTSEPGKDCHIYGWNTEILEEDT